MWYFFCPNEKKYASGARTNRATESGYWKSTGKDRPVFYNNQTVGMVKTLVFHIGHSPRGQRTNWVLYEYRIQDKELTDVGIVQVNFFFWVSLGYRVFWGDIWMLYNFGSYQCLRPAT